MSNESHGASKLKRAIAEVGNRGLRVIDPRTKAGRALMAWRNDLVTDLGGPAVLSTQQQAIVDLALRTRTLRFRARVKPK